MLVFFTHQTNLSRLLPLYILSVERRSEKPGARHNTIKAAPHKMVTINEQRLSQIKKKVKKNKIKFYLNEAS